MFGVEWSIINVRAQRPLQEIRRGIVARIIAIEDSPVLQRLIEIGMRGTGVEIES